MKVFVMVTTLTCGKVTERAKMLSQWIQIAVELRSTFGNLFGFASVMEGLTSDHVSTGSSDCYYNERDCLHFNFVLSN